MISRPVVLGFSAFQNLVAESMGVSLSAGDGSVSLAQLEADSFSLTLLWLTVFEGAPLTSEISLETTVRELYEMYVLERLRPPEA